MLKVIYYSLASFPPLNTDEAAKEFSMTFVTTAFTVGQELVFKMKQGDKEFVLAVEVKQITIVGSDGKTNDKVGFFLLIHPCFNGSLFRRATVCFILTPLLFLIRKLNRR